MTANKIMIVDLETENHEYCGLVASPRCPENYCVAIGQAIDATPFSGKITGVYMSSKEEAEATQWLQIPDDVWLLVAHNAPFEMSWFLAKQRQEIMKFLRRGGRIFDTAYAEYLLTHQQELYPALDETAPKYGGSHKVDGVKIMWETGKLTSQIDKDLLFDTYLLGPEGDIENTRKVFYGQVAKLQEQGMWDMALCRMEGLLFNCFAMDSGLHVNRETAFRLKGEQEAKLAELHNKFSAFRKDIPDIVEFKETSDYHMSAWLYGGPIKYREQGVWYNEDGTPKYEKVDAYEFQDGTTCPAAHFTDSGNDDALQTWEAAHGPVVRYKSGKNKGRIKIHRVDSDKPKVKWYDKVLNVKGCVDLDLLPKEIHDEFVKEFSGKRKMSDGSPVYSSGADAIELLSKRKEYSPEVQQLLTDLLAFAKVDKDLGTYYLREVADEMGNIVKQAGMLQYLTPQNVVYHILNCTSTVTTRLSSKQPNLQNLPRNDTSEVKKMFTSRYDDPVWLSWALSNGYIPQDVYDECAAARAKGGESVGVIVESDYSALEVVTLAAFSKDPTLVKALTEGTDMHCLRLAKKLGEPYEDVYRKCHDESDPEHKAYKTMRTNIKPPSFAYQYGATAMGISFSTGMPLAEAEEFIKNEKELFPQVEAWYEHEVIAQVEKSVTLHREQTESGGWRMYGRGTWRSPGGTVYEFRQYPKTIWSDGGRVEIMAFKPTQMRNYPIQGESGFFVQGIAGQVFRWLLSKNFFGGRVCIINQVHDALYIDCCRSVLREAAHGVQTIMQSLPEFYKQYGYNLGVPFPAAAAAGESMYDERDIPGLV